MCRTGGGRTSVGVARDAYVADRDMNTVVLEVRIGNGVVAVADTILDASPVDEARRLADREREGLRAGTIEPASASNPGKAVVRFQIRQRRARVRDGTRY